MTSLRDGFLGDCSTPASVAFKNSFLNKVHCTPCEYRKRVAHENGFMEGVSVL